MRPKRILLLLPVLAVALAAAACGGSDEASAPPADTGAAPPAAGTPIPGGGLTVEEAIASDLEGPLMVAGALFAVEGEPVKLCSAIAESYPPQCGGASLVVEGLDLASVGELLTEGGVSWAEHVSILGEVQDGRLVVSQTSI
jgi:hypothetical protein